MEELEVIKDENYHIQAIEYNEKLAVYAKRLGEQLEHPEIKRWCKAVEKQHRYHLKRHKTSLRRLQDGPDVDYRDAGSGKYVDEEYAKANPATTVAEVEVTAGDAEDDAELETTVIDDSVYPRVMGDIHQPFTVPTATTPPDPQAGVETPKAPELSPEELFAKAQAEADAARRGETA